MAEMKSAIFIIMERSNPTMTEEVRKAFQRKEWEGKAALIKLPSPAYNDGFEGSFSFWLT